MSGLTFFWGGSALTVLASGASSMVGFVLPGTRRFRRAASVMH